MKKSLTLLSNCFFLITTLFASSTLYALGGRNDKDCTEVDPDSIYYCGDDETPEPEDNPPLLNDFMVSLAEDAANGTFVVDFNDANTGNDTDLDGQALSYSLTDGNQDNIFTINPSTGILSVIDNSNLNYEVTQQYLLTVQASDGRNTDSASISIAITDVADETTPEPDILVQFDLAWTAPSTRTDGTTLDADDIAGYRIYYGSSPDNLEMLVDLYEKDATSFSVTTLSQGGYYFAVTTYDVDDLESGFSETLYAEKY